MGKNAIIKTPTLNPDGVSVKGCTHIYAPRGQAGEYAPLATNPYRGCGHGCAYCYVPGVIKMSRKDFDAGATPRENFLTNLRKDAAKYEALGITQQVMFSFTTDVYNPFDTSITRPAIEILIELGLAFCVLTKAGTRAWCDHDLYRPERDAFASTLTSLDERFLKKRLDVEGWLKRHPGKNTTPVKRLECFDAILGRCGVSFPSINVYPEQRCRMIAGTPFAIVSV